jgi:hypothetical protein
MLVLHALGAHQKCTICRSGSSLVQSVQMHAPTYEWGPARLYDP